MPELTDSTLHVRLPEALATAVAVAARKNFSSISEFTRQALLARVRDAGVPVRAEEVADAR
jgi:hypothetical protein